MLLFGVARGMYPRTDPDRIVGMFRVCVALAWVRSFRISPQGLGIIVVWVCVRAVAGVASAPVVAEACVSWVFVVCRVREALRGRGLWGLS